jgi:hypothetical protein
MGIDWHARTLTRRSPHKARTISSKPVSMRDHDAEGAQGSHRRMGDRLPDAVLVRSMCGRHSSGSDAWLRHSPRIARTALSGTMRAIERCRQIDDELSAGARAGIPTPTRAVEIRCASDRAAQQLRRDRWC